MVVSMRGDPAAASTDAVGAPSRMDRALSRVRDVLEPVGETIAVVTSVFGIVTGVVEIIRDVRYIVDSARGALDRGDGGGPPSKSGGAVCLADDASDSARLERKLIRTGERSYHGNSKLICKMRRDIPFENLPEDVIRTIFSQLPLQDLSPWLLENSFKFFGLKHLKLLMFHLDDDMHNILSLASFLKAAPVIEKFEIDFNIFGLINDLETDSLRSLPSYPYNYLRNVCITGYQGDIGQLELMYKMLPPWRF